MNNTYWVSTYHSASGGWNGDYGFHSYWEAYRFMNSYRHDHPGAWTVLAIRPLPAVSQEDTDDCRRLLLPS